MLKFGKLCSLARTDMNFFRIFALFNNYLWRGWKLCHKTVEHFLCSLILREYDITMYQRYWCVAPWVYRNGASVLSTIRH